MLNLDNLLSQAIVGIEDKRQQMKVRYPLKELLLQSLFAVLSGMETFEDIAYYGEQKLELLRKFYSYTNGTASEATLCRFFSWLSPECLSNLLMALMKQISPNLHTKLIAIDGKTVRGSHDGFKRPVHILSAFIADTKMVIGHLKVGEKTNEISMLPDLLQIIDIEGAIVSLDAMGCQRTICNTILERKGDYLISLKGNQCNLARDTKELFDSMTANKQDYHVEELTEVSANGSRVETRHYTATDNIVRLQALNDWPGLACVIKAERMREFKNEKNAGKPPETETAYYLCSRVLTAQQAAEFVRGHWSIENSLHYVLDVSYKEDKSRIRKANAPENMNILRKITTNIIRTFKDKKSFRHHRMTSALSDNLILNLFC